MCWQRTLSLLVALCAGVQGRDPPMVKIPDQGIVAGKEVAISRAQRATVFLGIPFAVPPVGQQGRFKEPITNPLPSWSDIRNASMQAAACPQSIEALKEYEKIFSQVLLETIDTLEVSEDCLYLNIFIPDGTPPSEGWPVIVWFHSGNFSVGTTALWDGSALAVKQKVVIVVPAYRLNILGFYVVDEVSPGNYGLLDQVAALEWVNSKISVFGGDPDNVCIMGHGAGGISVGLHMLSPRSRGMFHRAIAMSGSALSMSAFLKEEDIQNYREYDFGCDINPEDIHITCMRNLDGVGLSREAWNIVPWGPVVDNTSNPFLPREPELILERGSFSKVDFMTGFAATEAALEIAGKVNNAEQGIPYSKFQELIENEVHMEHPENPLSNDSCIVNVNHLIEAIMFYYTPSPPTLDPALLRQRYLDYTTEKLYGAGVYKTAIYVSQYSTSTYVYRFDYKPKKSLIDIPEWAKVPHGFELPFVWGMPYWPSLTQIIWNGADRKVADNVMNLWTNFAKFGNPIQSGINIKWDIFKELSPGVMIIDRNFDMSDSTNFDHKAFEFWQTYYPSVIEASTICCNVTQIGIQIHGSPTLTGILATIVGLHYVVTS